MRDQLDGELPQVGAAHQDHEGVLGKDGKDGKVVATCALPGEYGEGLRYSTRSQRDAGCRWSRCSAGNTRHDPHRHSRGLARGHLFTPPAEHERVAPLEPNDRLSSGGVTNQELVDLFLGERSVSGPLADVDQHRIGARLSQELVSYQAVVHDDLGAPQQLQAAGGDQSGIAGAAAHQIHGAGIPPWGACRRGTHQPGTKPGSRRRQVAARQVDDDLHQSGIAADGMVDDEPGGPGLRSEKAGNVSHRMRAATDQKGNHDQVRKRGGSGKGIQRWVVVDEGRKHLTRNPPMAERVGDPERRVPALRMHAGSVSHQRQ